MGVSGDHHSEPRSGGVHAQLLQIMQNVNPETIEFERQRQRQCRRPVPPVVVASNGVERRYVAQLREHLRTADIAGVNDVLHAG